MSESALRLPLADPVAAQDPADYTWTVPPDRGEAHAVLFRDGQAQPRALCNGRRWQASWTPSTAHPCLACIVELRDQFRTVSAALAAAGIRLEPTRDDQRGDHFAGMDRPGEVDVIDPRDFGRNER